MSDVFKISTAILLIIALILLGPLILIASANTISEQANMGWYVPHNVWTYLSCYGIMICVRGGK